MIRKISGVLTLLAALIFLSTPPEARADGLSLNVSINTSALGQAGSSEIFFVLTDGNAPASGGNSATLSNFAFGTGGSGGLVDAFNAFGDVTSTTSLADGATMVSDQFTNEFAGFFTAGSQVSFLLNLTTNLAPGAPAPDLFAIYIVDPTGNLVGSSDPSGFDSLLLINIDSANPSVNSYSSIVSASPVGTMATPEPATLLLLTAGLLGLGLFRKRVITTPIF
jgi:hypothetical protein